MPVSGGAVSMEVDASTRLFSWKSDLSQSVTGIRILRLIRFLHKYVKNDKDMLIYLIVLSPQKLSYEEKKLAVHKKIAILQ